MRRRRRRGRVDLDFDDRSETRLPCVIGFVLLLTLLMMGVGVPQRAGRAGVDGAQPGSVGVAFGVLTLVFQHGWAEGLLDFTSPGFVIDWIPLFVLVVLVGLSMDYHVFVLSRIRERVAARPADRGSPSSAASATRAGVVTSAAAVMVSVFAIFATLSMLEMKMMGVGLAAAILLDATLIRLVMLPAVARPAGRAGLVADAAQPPGGRAVVETDPAYELAGR